MTYGEAKKQVLKLINQYSIAGNEIAAMYNNQQDYLSRIAALLNDAATEIATTARKIPALLTLEPSDAEDWGETLCFELPGDFYRFRSGDTALVTAEGRVLRTNRVSVRDRDCLLVPKDELAEGERLSAAYYRYPRLLDPDEPDENEELDNAPETHYAACYYAAGLLIADENAYLSALLMNKYADKLAGMGEGVYATAEAGADLYGFGSGGDGYGG